MVLVAIITCFLPSVSIDPWRTLIMCQLAAELARAPSQARSPVPKLAAPSWRSQWMVPRTWHRCLGRPRRR